MTGWPARALVFDTETTGVSKTDVVIQLGYTYGVVAPDGSFRAIEIYEALWRPLSKGGGAGGAGGEAVPMNPRAESVHGMSTDLCMSEGQCPASGIRAFVARLKRLGEKGEPVALVAHNLAFDRRMLMQTARRHDLADDLQKAIDSVPVHACTLRRARERASRSASGRPSFRLGHLYTCVSGRTAGSASVGPAHTASADARMAARVYAHMVAFPDWNPAASARGRPCLKRKSLGEGALSRGGSERGLLKKARANENESGRSSFLTLPPVPQTLHMPASAPLPWRDPGSSAPPRSPSRCGPIAPSTGGATQSACAGRRDFLGAGTRAGRTPS